MSIETVVERFFLAIEQGDVAVLQEIYSDDVEIWHNFSNVGQNKSDNIQNLLRARELAALKYEVTQRFVAGDTLVQRHIVQLSPPDRPPSRLFAAIFITVRNGKIVHINEYLDPAQSVMALSRAPDAKAGVQ